MQVKAIRRNWVLRLLCAFGLISAFLLIVWSLPGGLELTVKPVGGGESLVAVPLESGERFVLHYIHSVDHAPIWEEHSVDRTGAIHVEEERFVMFGAGMGHWQGHGTLTKRGPYQVIEGIHAPVGSGADGFVLRVGSPSVGHTLIWRGTRFNLSQVAPHRAVVVSARPLSGLSRLWRRLVPPRKPVLACVQPGMEPAVDTD